MIMLLRTVYVVYLPTWEEVSTLAIILVKLKGAQNGGNVMIQV